MAGFCFVFYAFEFRIWLFTCLHFAVKTKVCISFHFVNWHSGKRHLGYCRASYGPRALTHSPGNIPALDESYWSEGYAPCGSLSLRKAFGVSEDIAVNGSYIYISASVFHLFVNLHCRVSFTWGKLTLHTVGIVNFSFSFSCQGPSSFTFLPNDPDVGYSPRLLGLQRWHPLATTLHKPFLDLPVQTGPRSNLGVRGWEGGAVTEESRKRTLFRTKRRSNITREGCDARAETRGQKHTFPLVGWV